MARRDSRTRERPDQTEFVELLDQHRERLAVNNKQLAAVCGLEPSLLSEWKTTGRRVQLHHVNRLAWGLATLYEADREIELHAKASRSSQSAGDQPTESPRLRSVRAITELEGWNGADPLTRTENNDGPDYSAEMLDVLLDDLLDAAGFRAIYSHRDRNRVFNRLRKMDWKERVIRIGVFEWPGLSDLAGGNTNKKMEPISESQWTGLSKEVTRLVMALMGVKFEVVKVGWPNVHQKLIDGRVDLIAPLFLRVPMRMFNARLSRPVPNVRCPLCAVCSKAAFENLREQDSAAAERLENGEFDRDVGTRIRWIIGESEITEAIARYLAPLAPDHCFDRSNEEMGSIKAGAIRAVERGWEDGRIHVFPTELITAKSVENEIQDVKILGVPSSSDSTGGVNLRVPIAFAAAPGEKRLIEMIDECLEILERDENYVQRMTNESFGEQLQKILAEG